MLAHVEGTSHVASSVFDARYLVFCREHLGDPEARTLGEDARALGLVAADHGALARVQLVAWLFRSLGRGVSAAPIELERLGEKDVDRPELLPALRAHLEAVEILRCAVELERPFHARLPVPRLDASELEAAFARVTPAAPALGECEIRLVRSLRLRGRILDREIWVGVPDPVLGPTHEHVSWQAAHEATVAEVSASGPELAEREVERAAVVLLAERARRSGLGDEHSVWLAHFGKNAPSIEHGSLPVLAENVVDGLLRAGRSSAGHG